MAEVTLSSKNQIVIPREAREALGVSAGDKLLVVVRGNTVIVIPRPKSWTDVITGIAEGLYPADYLATERASWE